MKRRTRRALEIGGGAALIALPPPGDEAIGLSLLAGAGIGVGKMANDTRPASNDNPRRMGATADEGATPRYTAYIVIGAIVILALEAGLFRKIIS